MFAATTKAMSEALQNKRGDKGRVVHVVLRFRICTTVRVVLLLYLLGVKLLRLQQTQKAIPETLRKEREDKGKYVCFLQDLAYFTAVTGFGLVLNSRCICSKCHSIARRFGENK